MKSFVIKGNPKEITSNIIEYFKNNLNKCIEVNGMQSPITLKLSQEVDKLMVAYMRGGRL